MALAVPDVEPAGTRLAALGFEVGAAEVVAHENVKIRKALKTGLTVELLEPYPPATGGIARFLARRGSGLHHVAFLCEDLATGLKKLADCGIRTLPNYPATGSERTRVAFLHPSDTGGLLIELVERERFTE